MFLLTKVYDTRLTESLNSWHDTTPFQVQRGVHLLHWRSPCITNDKGRLGSLSWAARPGVIGTAICVSHRHLRDQLTVYSRLHSGNQIATYVRVAERVEDLSCYLSRI